MLISKVQGNFTSKSITEIAVDTEGCEPHSSSFGGLVLLHNTQNEWQQVYYQPSFRLNECLAFATDKYTNILVCNETDMAQGQLFGQFSAFYFHSNNMQRKVLQGWFVAEDNSINIKPLAKQLSELDSDGRADLQIQFSVAGSNIPKQKIALNFIFTGDSFVIANDSKADQKVINRLLEPYLATD